MDKNNKLYVILSNKDCREIENSQNVKIYGISHEIDFNLKKLVIELYNNIMKKRVFK